ncbi:MAG: DUF6869 domain-containing protein [Candidatus Thiodiazotropha endolucinida]
MVLATDWIKSAELQLINETIEDSYAKPIVDLLELCNLSPRKALDIIYEIISRNPSDDVIGYLGAGPLEDILTKNCEPFIDELIEKSKKDKRLLLCLRSVDLDDCDCTRAHQLHKLIK